MTTQVISYRVPPEQIEAIDKLCSSTDRSRAYHMRRALVAYLEANSWQIITPKELVK